MVLFLHMSKMFSSIHKWGKASCKCYSVIRTVTNFRSLRFTHTDSALRSYFDDNDVYSKNREIDTRIKSGSLEDALVVFDNMGLRDVVTYNLVISGHGRCGNFVKALHLYAEMVLDGIRENALTFPSVLSVCGDAGFDSAGLQVHCRVIRLGHSSNLFVGGAIVDFFFSLELHNTALKMFDELPERNLAAWNIVLRGFCEQSRLDDLMGFHWLMALEGVEPNGLAFCYLLRGCSNSKFLDGGKKLQGCIVKHGFMESNVYVANALVDFYSACGCLEDAKKSFRTIPLKDVISWNSIVAVYMDKDLFQDALRLFNCMQDWGKRPSIRSLMSFMSFSGRTKNIYLGKLVHSCVFKSGFGGSVHIQSALINMYGKCGDIRSSVSLFEFLPGRSLECCNSLITSLSYCGATEDVVEMFGLMVDEGIGLDGVTFSTALKALSVSPTASLSCCQLLHALAIKSGFEADIAVACSLIDSYSRCGHVKISCQVFKILESPNEICFTSMINGYARNGMGRDGLELLQSMIKQGLKPDKATFLCALSGCNHTGLVEEGRRVFESMKSLHGVDPDCQHLSCMIGLLCRAGLLCEAEELLLQLPGEGSIAMWCSLLRSCRVHKSEAVGRRVAEILMELEQDDAEVWLQASNFYAEIGEFDTSIQIREIALARKTTREIGRSYIEIKTN